MRIFEQKPEQNIGLKPFFGLLMIVVFLMGFTFYKLDDPKLESKSANKLKWDNDSNISARLEKLNENVISKPEDRELGITAGITKRNLYFDQNEKNEWGEQNQGRNTYIFGSSDDSSFLTKLAEPAHSKNSKVKSNSKTKNLGKSVPIHKIKSKPVDLSEIKIHGPIQFLDNDKSYHDSDTSNLEVLKKLVKKFSSDDNAEVKIKIDGKLITAGADLEKELGNRKIKNIRIVLSSEDAESGLVEIITDDIKEMQIEEMPAEEEGETGLVETSEKANAIAIDVFYETKDGNYSGEMSMDVEKESVLDVLGYKSSEILFVVDGVEKKIGYKPNNIEPNNIESITVLKDKKATDKYGDKAKNGVIEIYLKKE